MVVSAMHIARLGDNPRTFAKVMGFYAEGLDQGAWTQTRRTPDGNETCLAAFDGDDLVGFALVYQPDHRSFLWLDLLYVCAARRRQGIGRKLLEAVERHARQEGLGRVDLGVFISNQAARALYSGAGFTERASFCELELILQPGAR